VERYWLMSLEDVEPEDWEALEVGEVGEGDGAVDGSKEVGVDEGAGFGLEDDEGAAC